MMIEPETTTTKLKLKYSLHTALFINHKMFTQSKIGLLETASSTVISLTGHTANNCCTDRSRNRSRVITVNSHSHAMTVNGLIINDTVAHKTTVMKSMIDVQQQTATVTSWAVQVFGPSVCKQQSVVVIVFVLSVNSCLKQVCQNITDILDFLVQEIQNVHD